MLHFSPMGFDLWRKNSFMKYCCLCKKNFICLGCHTSKQHRIEDWVIIWDYHKK
jgi:hypothetical protein